jgi:tRNA(Ile)-lysidine synthase TilS/MesJ
MNPETRYIEAAEKRVGLAINRYSLISGGDNVLVALSGGKDSLVMLETLANRRRRLPVTYGITAAHVHIKNIGYSVDRDYMADFCAKLSVPLHIIEAEADLESARDKSVCFVCAWLRRKKLFDLCESAGCGILALGHHMDDAVETLIMNMMLNGTISSMPPALDLFSGKLKVIRPLILLEENEIAEYSRLRKFPPMPKDCPHSKESKRADAKKIIQAMTAVEKDSLKNIYKSMSNIHSEYLPTENNRQM